MLFNLQSSAAVIFLCVDDVEEKALAEEQETWIPEWAGSALQSRYCEPLITSFRTHARVLSLSGDFLKGLSLVCWV